MLILHIMASRGLGGAETYATDVILSLHKAGIRQCVVMAKDAPRYAELQAAGVSLAPQILAIPFRPLQKYLLSRLLRRERPDIVHCWMRRAASLIPKGTTKISHQSSVISDQNLITDNCSLSSVVGWFGGYYEPKHFERCTHFV